jgi:hypothetical protein
LHCRHGSFLSAKLTDRAARHSRAG